MADDRTPIDVPAVAPSGVPSRRRWVVRLAAGVGVVGAFAAVYFLWFASPSPPDKPPLPDLATLNDDPDDPLAVHNPGFVGPHACAPCHAARAAQFQKTAHARACRRPEDGPMPPGFEPGRGHYVSGQPGLRFEMTRENGSFYQTAIEETPTGERRSKARIDLVYGANKADEVFFTWRDDRLYELMAVWLHPSNQWANQLYNRYGSGGFAREGTTRCLECHNTWFHHVPGTPNQYKPESFILGATCERCHGPGKEHVEFHRAHPDAGTAHAVVHPGRLSRERLMEVCTQCHGNMTKPRTRACTYRPGEILEEYVRTAVTKHPEEDHVANQVKYLRQSKCFQKSEMTCVTCHDPHRPHEKADAAHAHKSCQQCHTPDACTDRPNLPAAVRDNCVGCHMRQDVWMNVHFHTPTDSYTPPIRRYQHRIAKDPIGRSEVLLAWHRTQSGPTSRREADRLMDELSKHWFGEVESRRRDYRFMAAIGAAREVLQLDPPPPIRDRATALLKDTIAIQSKIDADLIEALHAASEQRTTEAIEILKRILTVKPNMAIAHAKIGTLYATIGERTKSEEHLEVVARHDPDNAAGLSMLGWLAYLEGRHQQAIEYYRRAEPIEPYDAKLNYHWGLALLRLGRWDETAERFRKALAIDPVHAGAAHGLAHVLRQQRKPAEAVRYAWRAAKATDFQDPDVLVTLADAYSESGRALEAAAAAIKAMEIDDARAGQTRLPFDVRLRLQDMRTRAGY
jgi:tetratricopeptide (TPR) repeat protein